MPSAPALRSSPTRRLTCSSSTPVPSFRSPSSSIGHPAGGPSTRPRACSTSDRSHAAMRIDVFTIFPGLVGHFADQSLVGKARAAGTLDVRVHDLRSCATDPHRSLDDAVGRLVPGVMGNEASAGDESFSDGLLEYPHYTRPADFRGWQVPDVLRSGDHGRVARWRRAQALRRTLELRPDLIDARGGLDAADRELLSEFDLDRDLPPGTAG